MFITEFKSENGLEIFMKKNYIRTQGELKNKINLNGEKMAS